MSEVSSVRLGGWFSRGWDAFKINPKPIIGGSVILAAFYLIISLLYFVPFISLAAIAVQIMLMPVLTVGWFFLCLKVLRGNETKSSDIFSAFSRFGSAWATFVLMLLIVMAGLILLIIPGIIWSLKYGLSLFAVMDRNLKATECIRLSGRITKGHKGKLFVYGVVAFLFGLLAWPFSIGLQHLGSDFGPILLAIGIIPYLLQILVIAPWLGATYAAAYDSLVGQQQATQAEEVLQAG